MVGSDDPFLFQGARILRVPAVERWVWCQSCSSFYIKQDSFHCWFVCFFQKAMVNLHWPLLGYDFTIFHICLLNSILTYLLTELVWTFSHGSRNTDETPPRKPLKRVRRIRRRWDSPPRNQKRKSFVKRKKEEISLSLYYLRCEFPQRVVQAPLQ